MQTPFFHPILPCVDAIELEASILCGDVNKIKAAMLCAGEGIGLDIIEDYGEIQTFPEDARLLVLAGIGHNAGDAFVAAKMILDCYPESQVHVLFVFKETGLKALTQEMFDVLNKTGRCELIDSIKNTDEYTVCIDGILGAAFHVPTTEVFDNIIEAVNAHPAIDFRAAVDLPSGVGAESSMHCFRADFTYATGVVKQPLFEEKNANVVGRVRYIDIGFFDNRELLPAKHNILLPSVLKPMRQLRNANSYKKTFGHLFIISGSLKMPGALLMMVKAAIHSGVGLVTVVAPETVALALAPHVPEAMWVPCAETVDGSFSLKAKTKIVNLMADASAVLIGPGIGRDSKTHQFVQAVVYESTCPMVLDADALTSEVIDCIPKGLPCILTPHLGEFNRLCHTPKATYSEKRLIEFTKKHKCITALKGTFTRVVDEESIYVSTYGGPVLARGGSGDILSGITAGLLAQQPAEAFKVAVQAVLWHGMAADAFAREHGQMAVSTTQIIPYLSKILRGSYC